MDDWRLNGQEDILLKVKLSKKRFYSTGFYHAHCEFCWAKFSPDEGCLKVGYCTSDEAHWICEECFRDFKDMFQWEVD